MKQYFFTFFLMAFFSKLYTQPPGIDDSIMAIKKKWTRAEPFIGAYDPQLKPSQFPLIYKKTDSVAALFFQAYPQPTGTDAKWYVSIIGEPYFKGGPSPYQYTCTFPYYFYSSGLKKIARNDEPGTGASVYVNSFRFLVDQTGLVAQIDNKAKNIYKVTNTEGQWKGYPVYRINKKYAGYNNYRMVLLTRNGKLPWKPVTQLQYLAALQIKWKSENEKAIKDLEEGIVKSKKMIEDIKKMNLDQRTKDKMVNTAQTELDRQIANKPATIKKFNDFLQEKLRKIDDYITTHSENELQQQAVINEFIGNYSWEKFEDPSAKDALQLVYIDQTYFDKNLPSYTPQFITLSWYWVDAVAPLYFKKQFEENFPIEKLKSMLR